MIAIIIEALPRATESFIVSVALTKMLTPRRSKWLTMLIWTVVLTLWPYCYWPVRNIALVHFSMMQLMNLVLLKLLFRDRVLKSYLRWLSINAVPLALDIIASSVLLGYGLVSGMETEVYMSSFRLVGSMIMTIFFSVISVIITMLFRRAPKKELMTTVGVSALLAVSQTVLVVLVFYCSGGEITDVMYLALLLAMIPSVVVNIFSNEVIARSAALAGEQRALELERKSDRQQLEYYKLAQEKETTISKLRHDVANALQTAYVLIENGERKKGEELINSISGLQRSAKSIVYCKNQIVNTVLAVKFDSIEKLGTETKITVTDSLSEIPLSDLELSSVLTNLIDNAVRGCESAKKKYIELTIGFENGFYVFKISNTADEQQLKKSQAAGFITTKTDRSLHGLGLKIVKETAEHYGGSLSLTADDGLFTAIATFKAERVEPNTVLKG